MSPQPEQPEVPVLIAGESDARGASVPAISNECVLICGQLLDDHDAQEQNPRGAEDP